MKNLGKMAKSLVTEPEFTPEQKVTHVWNRGRFDPLAAPALAAEVSCPMCGRFGGYRVNDGTLENFCGWSCFQEECIATQGSWPAYQRSRPTLENCGVPEGLADSCWEEIQQPLEVTEQLKTFCESFRGFLLMPGTSGTGKSCASVCCMQKYLQHGEDCRFVNVADLFVTWLGLKQSGQSELGLLAKYSECEFLVLDDLGTRTPSEAFLDFIYLLVNKRSEKKSLGTIISTNLGYQALAEKLGDAILSRISSGMIVKFSGKDRRKPKF